MGRASPSLSGILSCLTKLRKLYVDATHGGLSKIKFANNHIKCIGHPKIKKISSGLISYGDLEPLECQVVLLVYPLQCIHQIGEYEICQAVKL